MVKIRCSKIGRVHRPFFRIGVFDVRTRRDGEAIEYLGYYDPILSTGQRVKLDKERAEAWLKRGAAPTPTVASFLKEAGVVVSRSDRRRKSNARHAERRKTARRRRKEGRSGGG
jgi:small subunit ribosomal protein S16